MTTQGRDLKTGDTIEVWWAPKRDTITRIEKYQGSYQDHADWQGVRIAYFAILQGGMTIFPHDLFERVAQANP